ncbi:Putative LOC101234602 [Caligus rogercresseyi]|uniref:LOC101234602 n=1 Tax=Caligus rogercresseyi TaxID=217165 RepID=A0A7T8KJE3_CALRO|nr:Putative LOC101234602 [Caligus rogercresseyi]
MDVTHVGNVKFLTIVDCGPSRFAVWRALNSESETEVCQKVGEVFSQMGPPGEVLCDNGEDFPVGQIFLNAV